MLIEVTATAVHRLSPSFVRVELGAAGLADFGVEGPTYDQRIKLIFPNEAGELPQGLGEATWWQDYLALPEDERGSIRTYTIREVLGTGADTRLVVDIVVHPAPHGPGSSWALAAEVGSRLLVVCPRKGEYMGGIEFAPDSLERLLLVGDESALPAIAAIVEQLPVHARGTAFVEVPRADDVQQISGPDGVEIVWLPRDEAPVGQRMHEATVAHLGAVAALPSVADDEVEVGLWETPEYSSSGEEIADLPHEHSALYAWIAGESKAVTGLRRVLVKDIGLDRSQVAFMGYWREGVAMRA
ncbi:siderophore-interacting protein [Nocardioides insulae]|uniref:siderophore-interacting protein n=1 Tax=Nocardioides insulae TaxID=394734 RepID=UPI001FE0ECEE|nr:siderophore-interacting protein [Nocardioides insulae]